MASGAQPFDQGRPFEPGATLTEDGMLIVPPGAMQPAHPAAVFAAPEDDPVAAEQQLFANGLVVPIGYGCPTEGHCDTPCVACRQSQFTGWSAAVDLLIYEPYWAGGTRTFYHDGDTDAAAGVRLTVGHESSHGGGMELRVGGVDFNDLEYVETATSPNQLGLANLTTFQFDFDLTQRVWIGDSSIVLGVGPRAGMLNYQFGIDPEMQLNAGGLGLAATLHRPFWRSPKTQFAAVGFGRGSIMGGNVENAAGQQVADGTLSILEAGFGLEMRRQCWGGDLVGRIMYESQWWDSNLMSKVYLDGLSLRVGYQW
ncbi:hypothetical protein K2D_10040 [Planctomycetes bacterium K2D]|uniref:Uncharacterized protein n=2 Tax=Botrimarina mediterranea TaxID=2528022 RepID=A0A518K4W6_9BACT|nr:hypothetical protein Spa11_10230 [Botrimarina mediterranea]QDV77412.1 hypothetical protein K2D_10040 [Planctomycetes bacterium K2D]